MQTIKVTIYTDNQGITTVAIDDVVIAKTWEQDGTQYSEMKRILHPYGCNQDMHQSLPDAVEFIMDAICTHFAAFGLNVENE